VTLSVHSTEVFPARMAMPSSAAARAAEPNRAKQLDVAILPVLPAQAGMSMRLYVNELLDALAEMPAIGARVAWPPFADRAVRGRFANAWVRNVSYVRWARSLAAELYHVSDHANAQLLRVLPAQHSVITCHDLYPAAISGGRLRFPGAPSRTAMLPTAHRLRHLRRAAAVVVISKHTGAECLEYFGVSPRKMFLGYHGVDERFRLAPSRDAIAEFRAKHNFDSGAIHVLHVGSNDARKNLRAVFGVVAALRHRAGRAVRLVKAGDPFGPAEQRALAEFGITDAARVFAGVAAGELALLNRACDCLLYPSYHEGFCRPVAEAMASGLPVVTSDRGAIPEVVQGTAPMFAPDDVDGMAREIAALSDSADLRAERSECGELASRKFTWRAHAEAVAEAYRSVAPRWL
jgi:glycosyltransferase involved in cell wall biosynthesis